MKTLLSVLFLLATLFSCNSEQKAVVKTIHLTEYSAHKKDGKIVKGNINHSYSIGRYENGSQKYFVGLLGYQNTDTTWFDREELSEKKNR